MQLPKDDGFDYYKYVIKTDPNGDDAPADFKVDASPEQMLRAMHPTGERVDMDKEKEEMNDEEKAAFDALSAADDYDELEDDFLMLANEGQVALQMQTAETDIQNKNISSLKDDAQEQDNQANSESLDEHAEASADYRLKVLAML